MTLEEKAGQLVGTFVEVMAKRGRHPKTSKLNSPSRVGAVSLLGIGISM